MSYNDPQTDPDMPFEGWLVVWGIVAVFGYMLFTAMAKTKTVPSFPRG